MKIKKILPYLLSLVVGAVPIISIVSCSASTSTSQQQSNPNGGQPSNPPTNQPLPNPPSDESTPPNDGNQSDNKPSKDLDSLGGLTNNKLTTDSYKVIVDTLNLKPETILSSLTNDDLNKSLHKQQEYKDLSLVIVDGSSELTKTLKLKLTGTYNGKYYDGDIKIIGFSSNEKYSNDFKVSNINLNKDIWFDNDQPIYGSDLLLTSEKDKILDLISDAYFTFNNNKTLYFNDVKNDITEVTWKIDSNKTKIENINFTLSNAKKVYNQTNSLWEIANGNDNDIKQATSSKPTTPLPTLKDLMQIMINHITIKEDKIKEYYPSYFKGLFLYSVKNDEHSKISHLLDYLDVDSVINKYKQKYFLDKKIDLEIAQNSENELQANDWDGTLSFNTYLVDQQDKDDTSTTRKFEVQCKSIQPFIDSLEKKQRITVIKDSSLYNSLYRNLKIEIGSAFQNREFDKKGIEAKLFPLKNKFNGGSIFELNNNVKNTDNAKILNTDFSFTLFGLDLSGDNYGFYDTQIQEKNQTLFDYSSGLFNIYKKIDENSGISDNIFLVDGIRLDYNKLDNIKLAKKEGNENLVELSVYVPIIVTISNKDIILDNTFIVDFPK